MVFLRGMCGEAKLAGFRPSEFPVMARQCSDLARVRPISCTSINPWDIQAQVLFHFEFSRSRYVFPALTTGAPKDVHSDLEVTPAWM